MHKNIKRFGFDGIIGDDADMPRLREQFEIMVIKDMRESGFVPVLGLGPFFSTFYENEKYKFILSIHGFYVGREKACKIEGMTVEGNEMKRPTPPSRSSTSSESAK